MSRIACIASLLLSGCVTFPIPPADMGSVKQGDLGALTLKIACEYKPNWSGVARVAARRWLGAGDGKTVVR